MNKERGVLHVKIIHMGGTFGMVKYKNYFKVQPGVLEPYLKSCVRINHGTDTNKPYYQFEGKKLYYSIYEDKIKDSSNLDLNDCTNLIALMERFYEDYDAFVIIHGTDTISFTASAISFLIENISMPIIFTGAIIAINEADSDALDNLEGAFQSLLRNITPNIYLYFNNKLLQGNRTSKINSEGYDAFSSKTPTKYLPNGTVKFFKNMSKEVTVFKLYPGTDVNKLKGWFKQYKGVVVESYGSGNVPENLIKTLEECSETTIFLNISQCLYGIASNIYENGNALFEGGIVYCGHDMTSEAAYMKLSFLLGNFSVPEVKEMLKQNIRGETSH